MRSEEDRRELAELLAPFSANVLWMGVESAEMLKHALNGFLATSVAFVNEIAVICESVGADAAEVARGLKSDPRIGPRAYLSPGEAFAGGTLARDIGFLTSTADWPGWTPHVSLGGGAGQYCASQLDASASYANCWTGRRIRAERFLAGRVIAVWGLAYKPGTDTLRRSGAVELCRWLARVGAGCAPTIRLCVLCPRASPESSSCTEIHWLSPPGRTRLSSAPRVRSSARSRRTGSCQSSRSP